MIIDNLCIYNVIYTKTVLGIYLKDRYVCNFQ